MKKGKVLLAMMFLAACPLGAEKLPAKKVQKTVKARAVPTQSSENRMREETDAMQKGKKSLTQKDLDLQSQAQNESRSYNNVSKISKTRHKKVKSSISNVR